MPIPDPKGFSITSKYEPDKDGMIRALRAVLEHPVRKKESAELVSNEESSKTDGAA